MCNNYSPIYEVNGDVYYIFNIEFNTVISLTSVEDESGVINQSSVENKFYVCVGICWLVYASSYLNIMLTLKKI